MLVKKKIIKHYLRLRKYAFSSLSKIKSQVVSSNKKGIIYIKSTSKNIFCTLIDVENGKVKTSCSLRVPQYENEFNERENLFKRGMLLGELFGDKTIELGFTEVAIYLDSGINKGRKGVIRGLGKKRIKISFIQLSKAYPHNGCRPSKVKRKKLRTKLKG